MEQLQVNSVHFSLAPEPTSKPLNPGHTLHPQPVGSMTEDAPELGAFEPEKPNQTLGADLHRDWGRRLSYGPESLHFVPRA